VGVGKKTRKGSSNNNNNPPVNHNNKAEVDKWLRTWHAAAEGVDGPVDALPKALLLLPATTTVTPPIQDIVKVCCEVVQQRPNLETLELVADVVRDRLLSEVKAKAQVSDPGTTLQAVKLLQTKHQEALTKVATKTSEHSRVGTLFQRFIEMDQLCSCLEQVRKEQSKQEQINGGSENSIVDVGQLDIVPWRGWYSEHGGTKVKWLLQHSLWHNPPPLGTNCQDAEEYGENLLQMWTLLSFYWGSAALWPRCTYKRDNLGQADICGEPLFVRTGKNGKQSKNVCYAKVSTRGGKPRKCGRPANFKCHRYGHPGGVCLQCLALLQTCLIGRPGPLASTDLYDAVVVRETSRHDGSVYILHHLRSRKPPKIPPNWRTSYRLKCSSLVGVVPLGASYEALSEDHKIYWAEVVPLKAGKGGIEDDWKSRADQKIAVRFLSRADCSVLPPEAESPLDIGTHVAILDLRVFVPEVISVLGIFAEPSFKVQMSQIPFIERLIGTQNLTPSLSVECSVTSSDALRIKLIREAIENSEIETVRRFAENRRKLLASKICEITKTANLYGTQLEAFTSALFSAVHCTQGPPGTGKSYVGVWLVIALDYIRQEAMKSGQAVGPIVALSYKNHALDEFLLDITKLHKLRPTELIRSGKPEHQELVSYTERNSREERNAQAELKNCIAVLRNAQRAVKDWSDLASHLLSSISSLPSTSIDLLLGQWSPSKTGVELSAIEALACSLSFCCYYDKVMQRLKQSSSEMTDVELRNLLTRVQTGNVPISLSGDTEKLFPEITEAAWHWTTATSQSLEADIRDKLILWLTAWLSGKEPPPRCAGLFPDKTRCLRQAAPPHYTFCDLIHGCKFDPKGNSCPKERIGAGLTYCEDHCCHHELATGEDKCTLPCLDIEGCSFCVEHCCMACVETSTVPMMEKEHSACKLHQCGTDGCVSITFLPHKYCYKHCCSMCLDEYSNNQSIVYPVKPNSKFCDELHGCRANRCSNVRYNSMYCVAKHACQCCLLYSSDPSSVLMVDPKSPDAMLCTFHRCSHPSKCDSLNGRGVYEPSLGEDQSESPFCGNHYCRICEELNLPLDQPAEDEPPRNTCFAHPLCNYVYDDGELCQFQAEEGSEYCEEHTTNKSVSNVEKVQCSGYSKKKRRQCKATGVVAPGRKFYCDAHLDQDTEQDMIVEEQERQCQGITKKKKRCRNKRLTNEPEYYCPDHAAQQGRKPQSQEKSEGENSKKKQSETNKKTQQNTPESKNNQKLTITRTQENNKENKNLKREDEEKQDKEDKEKVEGITKDPNTLSSEGKEVNDESKQVGSEQAKQKRKGKEKIEDVWNFEEHLVEKVDSTTVEISLEGTEELEDGIGIDIHPDELDWSSEEEINEEIQHLQDILGFEEDSLEESDDESDEDESIMSNKTAQKYQNEETVETAIAMILSWHWKMPIVERWQSTACVLQGLANTLMDLCLKGDSFVAKARLHRAEAAAHVFRKARIIGATVVGASRRLEALRAAEPFAVVVEEACEVMEPTLMSVLAVRSLKKLELVGDHRQLPAFVQNCWYNVSSTNPSIKTSLFERLITNAEGTKACTILDEQRRMRPIISDITRCDYDDVVDIKDHHCTVTQRIGDVVIKQCTTSTWGKVTVSPLVREIVDHRSLWEGKGKTVPGTGPCIFFWNLKDSREGRAKAGVSACNNAEADAVVGLTKYLLLCGVPKGSISIITPYKGQKMTIVSGLRRARLIPSFHEKNKMKAAELITVSTVDRYQGDENDIVILSIVRSRPGNRFVALHNRFIVAMSRARIGFFVVGCEEAVTKKNVHGGDGPSHWRRFITQLKQNTTQQQQAKLMTSSSPMSLSHFVGLSLRMMCQTASSNEELEECEEKKESTDKLLYSATGTSFPLCCPRHLDTKLLVKEPKDFPTSETWSKFCNKPCPHVLYSCGHKCAVTCHSPTLVPHTQVCMETLPRPCPDHKKVPLYCKDVVPEPRNNLGVGDAIGKDLEKALKVFLCAIEVTYHRPECNHVETLPCYWARALREGNIFATPLPKCVKLVSDFVHPICNHVIKMPTCYDRRKWEKDPPKCLEEVCHKRKCGCEIELQCWKQLEEVANPPPCLKAVNIVRPRCRHLLSLRCHVGTSLLELWQSKGGFGVQKSDWSLITNQKRKGKKHTTEVLTVQYGKDYGPPESSLLSDIKPCSVRVQYQAACGHQLSERIPCDQAFTWASNSTDLSPLGYPCQSLVKVSSPLCTHKVQVPCWSVGSIVGWKPWGSDAPPLSITEDSESLLSEASLRTAAQTPNSLSATVNHVIHKSCDKSLIVLRQCGGLQGEERHLTPLKCSQVFRILSGTEPIPSCQKKVSIFLPCGHKKEIKCHEKGKKTPKCHAAVTAPYLYPCGLHPVFPGTCDKMTSLQQVTDPKCPQHIQCVHYRCGHTVTLPCYLRKVVEAELPGKRAVRSKSKEKKKGKEKMEEQEEKVEVESEPVSSTVTVLEEEVYCDVHPDAPKCTDFVNFRFVCGHELNDVPCWQAFEWANNESGVPPCTAIVKTNSPLCHHLIEVKCWQVPILAGWIPWKDESPIVEQITESVDKDGTPLVIDVVKQTAEPPVLPQDISVPNLHCGHSSMLFRDCGHLIRLPCIEAHGLKRTKECTEIVIVKCKECEHKREVTCAEKAEEEKRGVQTPCQNKVEKICTKCHINSTLTECFRGAPECGQQVTTLRSDCGHSITWDCGKDENPFTAVMPPCFACIIPMWKTAAEDNDHNLNEVEKILRELVLSSFPEDIKYNVHFEVPMEDIANLVDACLRITRCFCDKLESGDINSWQFENNDTKPPKLSDPKNYDVVFSKLNSEQCTEEHMRDIRKTFTPTATQYGHGTQLSLLSAPNLKLLRPQPDTNQINICIGVAFHKHALLRIPPFRQENAKTKNQKSKANRISKQYQSKGYDCVEFCLGDKPQRMDNKGKGKKKENDGDFEDKPTDRVYWTPGSCLPLVVVTVELYKDCSVCLDQFSEGEGYKCKEQEHFFCWDCVSDLVESAKRPDARKNQTDGKGNLACPTCRCPFHFSSIVRQGCPPEVVDQLIELQKMTHEQQVLPKALADERDRVTKEFERILAIKDQDERTAHLVRMEIIDEIISLRCPRCKAVFTDFSGCFALTCFRTECKAGFCAWCLKDCGADAHAHVPNCRENQTGGVFGTKEAFEEHHRRHRERLVAARIAQETREVKTIIRNLMFKDLADLGIAFPRF